MPNWHRTVACGILVLCRVTSQNLPDLDDGGPFVFNLTDPSFSPSDAPSLLQGTIAPSEFLTSFDPNTTAPTLVPTQPATENVTVIATASPTSSLTDSPSESLTFANITAAPSQSPSSIPTSLPSSSPSFAPTAATSTPRPTPGMLSETVNGLSMDLFGISEFPEDVFGIWQDITVDFQKQYFNSIVNSPVEDFDSTLTITSVVLPSPSRRSLRNLQDQDFVTVVYSQSMEYRLVGREISPDELAVAPFDTSAGRNAYLELLNESGESILGEVTSTSAVSSDAIAPRPTPAPVAPPAPVDRGVDDPVLSTGAIIGISVGGGILLLGVLFFFCCRSDDDYEGANEPPPSVSVKQFDEVSTLAPPQLGGVPTSIVSYGDQSVATVDYDYSKAYGGGGDNSVVSSVGGTFGSQSLGQSFLDPRKAGATGAALGSYSDNDSFENAFRDSNASMKEEILYIYAPPGKLGVVIDTPDDGAPVVHAVKDVSVIADKIQVGDKLIAVDDEDVRSMTAIKVSKLISRKSANPSRKLTILRMTVKE